MSPSFLIDNSAWARLNVPALPASRRAEVEGLLIEGEIAVCVPFILEAGYSARHSRDHPVLLERLRAMPRVHLDPAVEELAIEAQAQLARNAQHRIPPMDLLAAGLAHARSLALLHYDSDYEHILRHTALNFDSVWLAPQGSL